MRAIIHTVKINGREVDCLFKFTHKDIKLAKAEVEKVRLETGDMTMRLDEADMIDTIGD